VCTKDIEKKKYLYDLITGEGHINEITACLLQTSHMISW